MKGSWLCIARFFLRSIIPSKGHLALNCTVFGKISFLCDSDLEPHESRLKATFSEILISLKCTKFDKSENQWESDFSFRFRTKMVDKMRNRWRLRPHFEIAQDWIEMKIVSDYNFISNYAK